MSHEKRISVDEVPECCKAADLRTILCPRCDGYGYPGTNLSVSPLRRMCPGCNGLGYVGNPTHEWHDTPLKMTPNAVYRRALDARRALEKKNGLPPSRAARKKSQEPGKIG